MTPRLEDELRALRGELAWPPTPDVAAGLPARLGATGAAGGSPDGGSAVAASRSARAPGRRTRRRGLPRRRLALTVALLLALAVAAVPPARSAVLDVLGLAGGEEVRRVPELPPAPRRTSPAQAPGHAVTLAAARARARFPVRVPRALGAPDEVRLWRALPGGVVILVYGDRTALWAFRGSSTELVAKMVTPDTTVRPVRVGAARGTWLTGAPLQFIVQGRDGAIVTGTAATVDANVLVWSAGGVAYRLETREELERARSIAESLASPPGHRGR